METILITGASGLIGSELTNYLLSNNYIVKHLSRSKNGASLVKKYTWDINSNFLETDALNSVDHIIHLAGAGIADQRWTSKRKQEIIDSRVKSAELLYNEISKLDKKPRSFISASAIGYYGTVTSEKVFKEDDSPSNDFQGKVCKLWEDSSKQFENLGIRTVQLRFGVVLSNKGGALTKMLLPTKLGLGSALGTGKQFMPWIHINDVINIIEKSIKDEKIKGAYNVVSPSQVNNHEFTAALAKVLNKHLFMPKVPGWILRIVLGEMSQIILEGSRVSPQKIIDSGYELRFTNLNDALADLLKD